LYFVAGTTLTAVDVKSDGATFDSGIPKRLFDVRITSGGRNHFVVSKDGQRFLLVSLAESASEPFQVLVNLK
jgi:eukaryotic-like serine/threonine-protein kinase